MLEITLIILVIFIARLWMQRDIVSDTAPNIQAQMLNGKRFDLYETKTRPILVHFWATWCPVCKLEQSNIENIAKDKNVITIAMQSGDDNELKKFMNEENLTFNVINDENGLLSRFYNIKGVPVSFIVNKENKIDFIEVGYTTEIGLRLRLWWAGL
ncbi:MAG TPA: protein disulfide oxidoreductase [Gammaproteobacteria bacterium]|nr:protein disulfide oxidoreductase [Gammaproteobacteria bacterium]